VHKLLTSTPSRIRIHNEHAWPSELITRFRDDCRIVDDYINETDERRLYDEIEPRMRRLRYDETHTDDAIYMYREAERNQWSSECALIIDRMKHDCFPTHANHITHVHILDLHKDGYIRPHIDSIRYCGDIIAGISLLSDAVMRLKHRADDDNRIVDLLLTRRSLYLLTGVVRHEFTHQILAETESTFDGRRVPRDRRISIICRDMPNRSQNETP